MGYSKDRDRRSATLLNSILSECPFDKMERMIRGKPVFVIGAGPSISYSIPYLKRHKDIVKICADSALVPLMQGGIIPQIVVTDLDGDLQVMKKLSKTKTIFVVHAHGDNMERLEFASNFRNCIGTTQTEDVGRVRNFGGFTDGDRCVFLASHFGAKKIFLFGMDFGQRIGKHSKTRRQDRKIKLKKLRHGKELLEWLAHKTSSELYTLSKPITGFKKIRYDAIDSKLVV
ncbi:conserved hypothetical protein [Candidatus Nitrosotenuis uzonensis]|uniref:6-hydroxymethyl-7,8-dihydropterin pyrophosphokinase n=2 Tax=Candidatus Nitrosotenuis uzonensis TaxID=1407055 RepID=V6ARN4_9ARCH|nr:conserved hypothetical protein [Candidatus Nitrosotenuis uzonensis]